jgi:(2R)-sulfolactate sulfo-lyase subunit beta
LLRYEYDLKKAGDMMMDVIYDTVNGRLCKAEVMGHREFTFTKLYISA